jgi:peptidoglycan/xylan/chitin deacetylase (PgdA/CDA1 family)
MLTYNVYYFLKPFIPRSLQVALRKRIVLKKRARYEHLWPIDPGSARKPANWTGWPEGKRFALVLTHDIESAKGADRCRAVVEMEKKLGFRSIFNFVAEEYPLEETLFAYLRENGFEIGLHGLRHDGNLFRSKEGFLNQAPKINDYLKKWKVGGFRTPSMYKNLEWMSCLDIEYDMSTFDTDPFEPQPEGVGTIFPFWSQHNARKGHVELPYTLPQDFTLFVLMGEKGIEIWKKKLDWIADQGGMALLITHPDYMNIEKDRCAIDEYPVALYEAFLEYVKKQYEGQYWNPLPKAMARFWKERMK